MPTQRAGYLGDLQKILESASFNFQDHKITLGKEHKAMANSIAALCHDSATDRGSIAKCLQDAYDRNFSAFISGKASGLDTAYAAQFLYQRFGFDGRLVWHCKNSNIYGPSPDKTHYWEGERNPRKKRFKRRLRNPR